MNYNEKLIEITTALIRYLKENNLKIATAESCTGGLLSAAITDISGASEVFELGLCTYSAEKKTELLGVKKETIEKYNVVSCETASEMAEGLAKLSKADLCITTTGVAGPTGGTKEIPVGTVCIGFYIKGKTSTIKINFADYGYKTRQDVRQAAVLAAIENVKNFCS